MIIDYGNVTGYKRVTRPDKTELAIINVTLNDKTKCVVYYDGFNNRIIKILNQSAPSYCRVCNNHHCNCLDDLIPDIEKALLYQSLHLTLKLR